MKQYITIEHYRGPRRYRGWITVLVLALIALCIVLWRNS